MLVAGSALDWLAPALRAPCRCWPAVTSDARQQSLQTAPHRLGPQHCQSSPAGAAAVAAGNPRHRLRPRPTWISRLRSSGACLCGAKCSFRLVPRPARRGARGGRRGEKAGTCTETAPTRAPFAFARPT